MDYKLLLKAIIIFPIALALAYVLFILSYILVPIMLSGIIITVVYGILLVYREEQAKKKEEEDV